MGKFWSKTTYTWISSLITILVWLIWKIFRHNEEERGLLEIKHENETDDQLFELNERPAVVKTDELDVLHLPSPKPLPEGVHTLRIPSPVPHKIQDINLNAVSFQIRCTWLLMPVTKPQKAIFFSVSLSYRDPCLQDPELAPSRDELLQSHLKNWSNVRRRWRAASLRNEERYAASKEILTKMFERFVFIVEAIGTVIYFKIRSQLSARQWKRPNY